MKIRTRYSIFRKSVALLGQRGDIERVQRVVDRYRQLKGEIITSRLKHPSILRASFWLKLLIKRVAAIFFLIILSPVILAIGMAIVTASYSLEATDDDCSIL